ncbi:GTP-binding protein HflX [Clostridiaceae bacterium JG1575]|nr:GTP-binding protein HflX [Clostridiaceae bacterium JG1575]
MIYGNTDGVKDSVLKELEALYSVKTLKYQIAAPELIEAVRAVTERIGRELSVAIDRRGNVLEIALGDATSVGLPLVEVQEKKLSGARILHTHPNGNPHLSAMDLSALLSMKLDCMASVSCGTPYPRMVLGFLTVDGDLLATHVTRDLSLQEALEINVEAQYKESQRLLDEADVQQDQGERALLLGIESQESLDELHLLAEAADIQVMGQVLQARDKSDTAYYLGSGKLEEAASLAQVSRANLFITDDELSGMQIKNMEDLSGIKVIDRTTLILEIFSRRARSKEARLQIELAQLKYRSNRLMGMGLVLSRTGGGIGTRGPGETKLEIDRRRIRERCHDLGQELKALEKVRATQREMRHRQQMPQVALVGYTNAGKSTLRNALARDYAKESAKKRDVFVKDMLFATLDTTTRALSLPDRRAITLTDTVGFVRKLPHDLVEAFKSTLEEVIHADLIVHVVDGSSPDVLSQMKAVEEVLIELGAVNKPTLVAMNKMDRGLSPDAQKVLLQAEDSAMALSAKTGEGLKELMDRLTKMLPGAWSRYELRIPYSEQRIASLLHESGEILSEEFLEEGTAYVVRLPQETAGRLKEFIVSGDGDETSHEDRA